MVRRQNEEAIRLYRSLGFVRVRTVPNYYDDHSPGWQMSLKGNMLAGRPSRGILEDA